MKQIESLYFLFICLLQKLYILKMAYIQLPFGVKYNKENKISPKLPSNYKAEVLFLELLYLSHLDQPVFKEK